MAFIPTDLPPPPVAIAQVQLVSKRYSAASFKEGLAAPFTNIFKILPSNGGKSDIPTIELVCTETNKMKAVVILKTLEKYGNLASLFKADKKPPLPKAPALASIIKIPPADGNKEVPYKDLVCTETDQQNIAFIIQTMADNGKLSLLFKQSELKRIGAEINHVHPLKFLETIFSNPALKACMKEIHNDYFKWNGFLDGLVPSLTNHANQGKLGQYLKDFSMQTNGIPEEVDSYFKSKDWENLVRYLMNH